MKLVINTCYGGFNLSPLAFERYRALSGNLDSSPYSMDRDDPRLVQVVETLGEGANGPYAKLKVIEIPDDVEWEIGEYDGIEHVREMSRTWA